MSLDVYLKGEPRQVKCTCSECGNEHFKTEAEYYYEANITNNLGVMADAAGIYYALWRPENIGATKAKDIIELVEKGLTELKGNPERFNTYNAKNGWGTYDQFVPWVENYLAALKEHPEAIIEVSR